MSAARPLLAFLVLTAGCLGGPALTLEQVLAQSEAAYDADAGAYRVRVQGRLVNHADREQRILGVYFAVAEGCGQAPRDWAHSVVVENLPPGGSANVRTEFVQLGPLLVQPHLAYRVTVDAAQVSSGCGAVLVA